MTIRGVPLPTILAGLVLAAAAAESGAPTIAWPALSWPALPRPETAPFEPGPGKKVVGCRLPASADAVGTVQLPLAGSVDTTGRAVARGETLWLEVPDGLFSRDIDADAVLADRQLVAKAHLGWAGWCGPATLGPNPLLR